MAIKFDELLEAFNPSLDRFEEDLDSMWIIIPTERRYDDLTASDYDKFVRKYGTFNSRQECWDKIDELAPDRWDAFVPLRIDGDDSLSEDYTSTQSRTDKIIDFLAEHDQAWEDCCNYFGLDPWDEDALLKVNPTDLEDWIAEHDQLYSDLKNSLNESMSKEESRAKSLIINYLKRNSQPQVASLLNDFEFVLTKDPNITCIVDSDRKQITLNRNLSTDDAVLYILQPFRKQNLKDPKFIQWLKDTNKEAEKYMHYNESLNEAVNHENDEINALLRKYLGEKTIPEEDFNKIKDAGINIQGVGKKIQFEGPYGKQLKSRTKWRKEGPEPPENHSFKGYTPGMSWDLYSKQLKKSGSWEKADLKGYLDSDRNKSSYVDYKDYKDPGFIDRLPNRGNLRPYSDKYKHLTQPYMLKDKDSDERIARHLENSKARHIAKLKK